MTLEQSLHSLYTIPAVSTWVAEAPEVWPRTVREKLVHCLWFDPQWRPPTLRTLDGQEIIVHSPGRWNLLAGPDFHQAVLTFGNGARRRGDVEIHRYASDWTAHRHHLDARYNDVILHVVLWNDRRALGVTRADGHTIPQVILEQFLPRPLTEYQAEIVLDDYPYKNGPWQGQCYATLQRLQPLEVQAFLGSAGDVRLQHRVRRWAHRATEAGLPQAMYEAVMRGLGSTGHRQHFQALARLVSWEELQRCLETVSTPERCLAAEALVFGLAGILPWNVPTVPRLDEETQRYSDSLQQYWRVFPPTIRQRAWTHVNWRQPNVRPANTPERRLAGMAQLLAHYQGTNLLEAGLALCQPSARLTGHAVARTLCTTLMSLLDSPASSYWTYRAHMGSRKGRGQRLIGRQRALTVVVDAILPGLLVFAQQRADAALSTRLLACYQAAPRLPDNTLLRYMTRRLFGNESARLSLVTGARQQQGMLQIFADFCSNDEGDCQGCGFPVL